MVTVSAVAFAAPSSPARFLAPSQRASALLPRQRPSCPRHAPLRRAPRAAQCNGSGVSNGSGDSNGNNPDLGGDGSPGAAASARSARDASAPTMKTTTTTDRRGALQQLGRAMLALTAAAGVGTGGAGAARADRTGKYSTKLTAKRRYLPRIKGGADLLRAVGGALQPSGSGSGGQALGDAVGALGDAAPGLLSAMRLFATSYFAEGNRIGATERALGACADEFDAAVAALLQAQRAADASGVRSAYERARKAANEYIATAKLGEEIELL